MELLLNDPMAARTVGAFVFVISVAALFAFWPGRSKDAGEQVVPVVQPEVAKVDYVGQEVAVTTGGDPTERKLSQAEGQCVRWNKVLHTFEKSTAPRDVERVRKAHEQLSYWRDVQALADRRSP